MRKYWQLTIILNLSFIQSAPLSYPVLLGRQQYKNEQNTQFDKRIHLASEMIEDVEEGKVPTCLFNIKYSEAISLITDIRLAYFAKNEDDTMVNEMVEKFHDIVLFDKSKEDEVVCGLEMQRLYFHTLPNRHISKVCAIILDKGNENTKYAIVKNVFENLYFLKADDELFLIFNAIPNRGEGIYAMSNYFRLLLRNASYGALLYEDPMPYCCPRNREFDFIDTFIYRSHCKRLAMQNFINFINSKSEQEILGLFKSQYRPDDHHFVKYAISSGNASEISCLFQKLSQEKDSTLLRKYSVLMFQVIDHKRDISILQESINFFIDKKEIVIDCTTFSLIPLLTTLSDECLSKVLKVFRFGSNTSIALRIILEKKKYTQSIKQLKFYEFLQKKYNLMQSILS